MKQKFGKRFHFGFDLTDKTGADHQSVESPPYATSQNVGTPLPFNPPPSMIQSSFPYAPKELTPHVKGSLPILNTQMVPGNQLFPDPADHVTA